MSRLIWTSLSSATAPRPALVLGSSIFELCFTSHTPTIPPPPLADASTPSSPRQLSALRLARSASHTARRSRSESLHPPRSPPPRPADTNRDRRCVPILKRDMGTTGHYGRAQGPRVGIGRRGERRLQTFTHGGSHRGFRGGRMIIYIRTRLRIGEERSVFLLTLPSSPSWTLPWSS